LYAYLDFTFHISYHLNLDFNFDPVAGAPTGNIIDMNLVAMAMP
jgi:hypothetical protein